VTAEADALRRSPLGATGAGPHALLSAPDVVIRELPFTAQFVLRLDPMDTVVDAVERALGARPGQVNLVTTAGGTQVMALAPDEWLVVGPADADALEAAVRSHGGVIVDVSAHRTVLELTGSGVRDLLASGTSVDLHPRAFAAGQCRQTTLARVDVIIARVDEDTYRVFVRTSFARYLADWLTDALEGTR
jgi:sarcosine oxidase subunit gamma